MPDRQPTKRASSRTLPRLRRLVVATACAAAITASVTLVTTSAAPASAATDGLSSPDGVLYQECVKHPYRYSVTVPDGYDYEMTIDAKAIGPAGYVAEDDFRYITSTSGTASMLFCGDEKAGRYLLEAEVEACDESYNCDTITLPSARFRMREARTRTTLVIKPLRPRFNEVVRLVTTSREERPDGYAPAIYAPVGLELRAQHRWTNVKAAKARTDRHGMSVTRLRWNVRRPLTIRAITLPSNHGTGSASAARTVRTR